MADDNEDYLKNKEDLHIAGRHSALDIFRFGVFFLSSLLALIPFPFTFIISKFILYPFFQ